MSNIIDIFPTKIYKTRYENYQTIKESVIDNLSLNGNYIGFEGDYESTYNKKMQLHLDFPEVFAPLVRFLEYHAKMYWKQLGYAESLTPYIYHLWANKMHTGSHMNPHNHLGMPLCATVYLDASPEKGNLVFVDPNTQIKSVQPVSPHNGSEEFEIPVNSGDVVLFTGYLQHRVCTNMSSDDRIVLSVNFGARGEYWNPVWVSDKTA